MYRPVWPKPEGYAPLPPPDLPPLNQAAAAALARARRCRQGGDIAGALAALRAGHQADAGLAFHPWGMIRTGQPALRRMLKARLQSWYRGVPAAAVAELSPLANKATLHRWAEAQGIPVPRRIAQAARPADLDWQALGAGDLVVKPVHGDSNRGIILRIGGVDRLTGQPVPDLATAVAARWQDDGVPPGPVIVEEVLVDAAAAQIPGLWIPRDIKAHAVAGRAVGMMILDRNIPDGPMAGRRAAGHVDRLGRPIPAILEKWNGLPPTPLPPGFFQAIALVEQLSARFPWMLRIDVYDTIHGPVLGEITTYPSAGLGYTRFGLRILNQMAALCPDPGTDVAFLPPAPSADHASRQ